MSVIRLEAVTGFDCDAIGCDSEWRPPRYGVGSAHPDFNDCCIEEPSIAD